MYDSSLEKRFLHYIHPFFLLNFERKQNRLLSKIISYETFPTQTKQSEPLHRYISLKKKKYNWNISAVSSCLFALCQNVIFHFTPIKSNHLVKPSPWTQMRQQLTTRMHLFDQPENESNSWPWKERLSNEVLLRVKRFPFARVGCYLFPNNNERGLLCAFPGWTKKAKGTLNVCLIFWFDGCGRNEASKTPQR